MLGMLLWAQQAEVKQLQSIIACDVLQVGIYLPLYDHCLARLWGPTGMYAPLLAGSIARMVAVMCSAPLELMRTRMQVRSILFPATSHLLVSHTPSCRGSTGAARRLQS